MAKNEKVGIYKIECLPTKKIYIGMSKRIHRRWSEHRNELRKNKHTNSYLQNSWNKYGENSFKFSIIEELPKEKSLLENREKFWIKLFDSTNNNFGFNVKHSLVTKHLVRRNKGKDVIRRKLNVQQKNQLKALKKLKGLKGYSFPDLQEFNPSTFEELRSKLPNTANRYSDLSLTSILLSKNSRWGYIWIGNKQTGCDLLNKVNTRLTSGEFIPDHLRSKTKGKTGFKKQSPEFAKWKSDHLSGKPRPKGRKPFILDGKKYGSLSDLDISTYKFYKAKEEGRVQYV